MKSLPAGLQDHLNSGATTLAWCWRVTRIDGATFGFTDHDRRLDFDGTEFEPETGFAASEIREGSDLAVDAQDAEGALHDDRITDADIAAGLWDGAEIEAFRVNWQDTAQRVLMRRGTIGDITRGRVAFVAEIRSLAHRLDQPAGRTFQAFCDAELGDGRCGVNLDDAAFLGEGAVASAQGDRSFTTGDLAAFEDGWFTLGRLTWNTGANASRTTEVAVHRLQGADHLLILAEPPPQPIEEGDAFKITAGCDKRFATCVDKFSNSENFRGFPQIPGDDLVVRTATTRSTNTGNTIKKAR